MRPGSNYKHCSGFYENKNILENVLPYTVTQHKWPKEGDKGYLNFTVKDVLVKELKQKYHRNNKIDSKPSLSLA